ncbi:MAG: DUF4129 domain-containing protein [Caldiserica bacterium]|nr:DUF4129 domain-containing protein [Caldisericota bacterium]
MTEPRLHLQHLPERFAVAAVAGVLAWWFTHTTVPLWWAALPCVALACAVLSRRVWPTWLAWGAANGELATLLALTLRSLRFDLVFASITLAAIFAGLTAAACALVTSRGFPRQTASLTVSLAIAAALTSQGSPWIAPSGLAVLAAAGLLANRREALHAGGLRPLLPILIGLLLLVVIAGASPVGRSPAQGPLATFVQHALFPQAPAPVQPQQPQQPDQVTNGQLPSKNPVRYVAPMLQLWLHGLERTILPWATPLVLGLLALVLGLILLMLLTHSPVSHVLRMLMPALLILGGAVAVVVLASSWQLPRGGALAKLYEQLGKIGDLARAQQPAAIDQALREVTRAVPAWLQVVVAVFSSMAAVAIVVTVVLILSTAAFETRFGFLRSITDSQERKRVAASIRRMASLDESLLVANPREAVIALFYMGIASLQDLDLSLARGETPEELVIRARERSEPVASCLDLLVTAFYLARYSDQEVQPQQALASRDAYKSLVAAVKTEIENKPLSHLHIITLK